ncbi:WXG100-like domain-containing protein [Nocardia sp. X0981]
MGMTLTEALHGLLGMVGGAEWPEGDEDLMWELARALRAEADALEATMPDIRRVHAEALEAYPAGEAHQAMDDIFDKVESYLPEAVETLRGLAQSARDTGGAIESAKLQIYSALVLLALELILSKLFPPTSAVQDAAAIAATRLTLQAIARWLLAGIANAGWRKMLPQLAVRLAGHGLLGGGIAGLQDIAIQKWEIEHGNQSTGFRSEQTLAAIGSGVGGGILGAGAALGVQRLRFTDWGLDHLTTPRTLGLQLVGGGILGGVGGWLGGGLVTGDFTFDYRMISAGIIGAGTSIGGHQGIHVLGARNPGGPIENLSRRVGPIIKLGQMLGADPGDFPVRPRMSTTVGRDPQAQSSPAAPGGGTIRVDLTPAPAPRSESPAGPPVPWSRPPEPGAPPPPSPMAAAEARAPGIRPQSPVDSVRPQPPIHDDTRGSSRARAAESAVGDTVPGPRSGSDAPPPAGNTAPPSRDGNDAPAAGAVNSSSGSRSAISEPGISDAAPTAARAVGHAGATWHSTTPPGPLEPSAAAARAEAPNRAGESPSDHRAAGASGARPDPLTARPGEPVVRAGPADSATQARQLPPDGTRGAVPDGLRRPDTTATPAPRTSVARVIPAAPGEPIAGRVHDPRAAGQAQRAASGSAYRPPTADPQARIVRASPSHDQRGTPGSDEPPMDGVQEAESGMALVDGVRALGIDPVATERVLREAFRTLKSEGHIDLTYRKWRALLPEESLAREGLFGHRALRTPEAFVAALERILQQRALDVRQPEYALLRAFHSAVSARPIDITAEIRRLRVAQRLGIENPYTFYHAHHWELAVGHLESQLAQERAQLSSLDSDTLPAARRRLEARERLLAELVELLEVMPSGPIEGRPAHPADAQSPGPLAGHPVPQSAPSHPSRAGTESPEPGAADTGQPRPDTDSAVPPADPGEIRASVRPEQILTEAQERALKDELVRDSGIPITGYRDRAVPVETLHELTPLLRTLTERYPGALDGVDFAELSEHGDGAAAVVRDGRLVLDPRVVGLPVSRSAADLPLRELVIRRFAEALLARDDTAVRRAGESADLLRSQLRENGETPAARREWMRFRRMSPEQAMIEAFSLVEREGPDPTHPSYAYYHALVSGPETPLDLTEVRRVWRTAAEAGIPDPHRLGPGEWPTALSALRDRIDAEAADLMPHLRGISARAAAAALELHRDRIAQHAALFELVHDRPPEPLERPRAIELIAANQGADSMPLLLRTEGADPASRRATDEVTPQEVTRPIRLDPAAPIPVAHHSHPPPPISPPQSEEAAQESEEIRQAAADLVRETQSVPVVETAGPADPHIGSAQATERSTSSSSRQRTGDGRSIEEMYSRSVQDRADAYRRELEQDREAHTSKSVPEQADGQNVPDGVGELPQWQREATTLIEDRLAVLQVNTDVERLVLAALFIDKSYLDVAIVAGQPRPELLFGMREWAGFLDAMAFARDYGDRELTVPFVRELHRRLMVLSIPELAGVLVSSSPMGVQQNSPTDEQLAALDANPYIRYLDTRRETDHADGTDRALWIFYPEFPLEHPDMPGRENLESFLEALCDWYNGVRGRSGADPYAVAAALQRILISVHPFNDYNGRLSRLLMNWALENAGLPPSAVHDVNLDLFGSPQEWAAAVRAGSERFGEIWSRARHLGPEADPVELFGLDELRRRYVEIDGRPAPFEPEANHNTPEFARLLRDLNQAPRHDIPSDRTDGERVGGPDPSDPAVVPGPGHLSSERFEGAGPRHARGQPSATEESTIGLEGHPANLPESHEPVSRNESPPDSHADRQLRNQALDRALAAADRERGRLELLRDGALVERSAILEAVAEGQPVPEARMAVVDAHIANYDYAHAAHTWLSALSRARTTAEMYEVYYAHLAQREAARLALSSDLDRLAAGDEYRHASDQLATFLDLYNRARAEVQRLDTVLDQGLADPRVIPRYVDVASLPHDDGGAAWRAAADVTAVGAVDRSPFPESVVALTDSQLQARARGRILGIGDHAALTARLREMGPGASALVVDTHRYTGARRRYQLVNFQNVIISIDRTFGLVHAFTPVVRPGLESHAALFDRNGRHVDPIGPAEWHMLPHSERRSFPERVALLKRISAVYFESGQILAAARRLAGELGLKRVGDLSDPSARQRLLDRLDRLAGKRNNPRRGRGIDALIEMLSQHRKIVDDLTSLSAIGRDLAHAELAYEHHSAEYRDAAARLGLDRDDLPSRRMLEEIRDTAPEGKFKRDIGTLLEIEGRIRAADEIARESNSRLIAALDARTPIHQIDWAAIDNYCLQSTLIDAMWYAPRGARIEPLDWDFSTEGTPDFAAAAALGAEPEYFRSRSEMESYLTSLPHGAWIAVLDSGAGFGHSYRVINNHGRILVREWAGLETYSYPPKVRGEVAQIRGIVYLARDTPKLPLSERTRASLRDLSRQYSEAAAERHRLTVRFGELSGPFPRDLIGTPSEEWASPECIEERADRLRRWSSDRADISEQHQILARIDRLIETAYRLAAVTADAASINSEARRVLGSGGERGRDTTPLAYRDPVPPHSGDDAADTSVPPSSENGEAPDRHIESTSTDRSQFEVDPAEEATRGEVVDTVELDEFGELVRVEFADGSLNVYRVNPDDEEMQFSGIPRSGLIVREVAVSVLDRLLGAGLVPAARLWSGPEGPGSLTDFVPHRPPRPVRQYSVVQRHWAAVIDYIAGHVDRNGQNWATREAGTERTDSPEGAPELVLLDNTDTWPENADSFTFDDDLDLGRIRSPFVLDAVGQDLHPVVIAGARGLEVGVLRSALELLGLEPGAVADGVSRLTEIQENGRITGAAWPGLGVVGYVPPAEATIPVGETLAGEERAVHDREFVAEEEANGEAGRHDVAVRVRFEDDTLWEYRPESARLADGTRIPPSGMSVRDTAFARLDRLLGFGVVPVTTLWKGPQGPGSLMEYVGDVSPARAVGEYSPRERSMMAVLDYIAGTRHRTEQSWRTVLDTAGTPHIVPIEQGRTFPLDYASFAPEPGQDSGAPEHASLFESPFVARALGEGLDISVVEMVRALAPARLEAMLVALGLEGAAIDGALVRLAEIQVNGTITGAAFIDPHRSQLSDGMLAPVETPLVGGPEVGAYLVPVTEGPHVAQTRRLVREVMGDWPDSDQVDSAELLVSELAGNILRYADSRGFVIATVADSPAGRVVRVGARDYSPELPVRRDADEDAESGRGMALLELVATDSGIVEHGDGKTIWFEFRADPPDTQPGNRRQPISAERLSAVREGIRSLGEQPAEGANQQQLREMLSALLAEQQALALRERETFDQRLYSASGYREFRATLKALDDRVVAIRRLLRQLDGPSAELLHQGAIPQAGHRTSDTPFADRLLEAIARFEPAVTVLKMPETDESARVELLTFDDGWMVIRKFVDGRTESMSAYQRMWLDAEELGALVGQAVGARVPAVHIVDGVVYMEFIEGPSAAAAWQEAAGPTRLYAADNRQIAWPYVNLPDGRLMGLMDGLIANDDRHAGNWIINGPNRLFGIDHELSFVHQRGNSLFADRMRMFVSLFGPEWIDPVAPMRDFAEIRDRLDRLQPEFEIRGRASWHDQMMRLLDDIEVHAVDRGRQRLDWEVDRGRAREAVEAALYRVLEDVPGDPIGTPEILARPEETVERLSARGAEPDLIRELSAAVEAYDEITRRIARADRQAAEVLASIQEADAPLLDGVSAERDNGIELGPAYILGNPLDGRHPPDDANCAPLAGIAANDFYYFERGGRRVVDLPEAVLGLDGLPHELLEWYAGGRYEYFGDVYEGRARIARRLWGGPDELPADRSPAQVDDGIDRATKQENSLRGMVVVETRRLEGSVAPAHAYFVGNYGGRLLTYDFGGRYIGEFDPRRIDPTVVSVHGVEYTPSGDPVHPLFVDADGKSVRPLDIDLEVAIPPAPPMRGPAPGDIGSLPPEPRGAASGHHDDAGADSPEQLIEQARPAVEELLRQDGAVSRFAWLGPGVVRVDPHEEGPYIAVSAVGGDHVGALRVAVTKFPHAFEQLSNDRAMFGHLGEDRDGVRHIRVETDGTVGFADPFDIDTLFRLPSPMDVTAALVAEFVALRETGAARGGIDQWIGLLRDRATMGTLAEQVLISGWGGFTWSFNGLWRTLEYTNEHPIPAHHPADVLRRLALLEYPLPGSPPEDGIERLHRFTSKNITTETVSVKTLVFTIVVEQDLSTRRWSLNDGPGGPAQHALVRRFGELTADSPQHLARLIASDLQGGRLRNIAARLLGPLRSAADPVSEVDRTVPLRDGIGGSPDDPSRPEFAEPGRPPESGGDADAAGRDSESGTGDRRWKRTWQVGSAHGESIDLRTVGAAVSEMLRDWPRDRVDMTSLAVHDLVRRAFEHPGSPEYRDTKVTVAVDGDEVSVHVAREDIDPLVFRLSRGDGPRAVAAELVVPLVSRLERSGLPHAEVPVSLGGMTSLVFESRREMIQRAVAYFGERSLDNGYDLDPSRLPWVRLTVEAGGSGTPSVRLVVANRTRQDSVTITGTPAGTGIVIWRYLDETTESHHLDDAVRVLVTELIAEQSDGAEQVAAAAGDIAVGVFGDRAVRQEHSSGESGLEIRTEPEGQRLGISVWHQGRFAGGEVPLRLDRPYDAVNDLAGLGRRVTALATSLGQPVGLRDPDSVRAALEGVRADRSWRADRFRAAAQQYLDALADPARWAALRALATAYGGVETPGELSGLVYWLNDEYKDPASFVPDAEEFGKRLRVVVDWPAELPATDIDVRAVLSAIARYQAGDDYSRFPPGIEQLREFAGWSAELHRVVNLTGLPVDTARMFIPALDDVERLVRARYDLDASTRVGSGLIQEFAHVTVAAHRGESVADSPQTEVRKLLDAAHVFRFYRFGERLEALDSASRGYLEHSVMLGEVARLQELIVQQWPQAEGRSFRFLEFVTQQYAQSWDPYHMVMRYRKVRDEAADYRVGSLDELAEGRAGGMDRQDGFEADKEWGAVEYVLRNYIGEWSDGVFEPANHHRPGLLEPARFRYRIFGHDLALIDAIVRFLRAEGFAPGHFETKGNIGGGNAVGYTLALAPFVRDGIEQLIYEGNADEWQYAEAMYGPGPGMHKYVDQGIPRMLNTRGIWRHWVPAGAEILSRYYPDHDFAALNAASDEQSDAVISQVLSESIPTKGNVFTLEDGRWPATVMTFVHDSLSWELDVALGAFERALAAATECSIVAFVMNDQDENGPEGRGKGYYAGEELFPNTTYLRQPYLAIIRGDPRVKSIRVLESHDFPGGEEQFSPNEHGLAAWVTTFYSPQEMASRPSLPTRPAEAWHIPISPEVAPDAAVTVIKDLIRDVMMGSSPAELRAAHTAAEELISDVLPRLNEPSEFAILLDGDSIRFEIAHTENTDIAGPRRAEPLGDTSTYRPAMRGVFRTEAVLVHTGDPDTRHTDEYTDNAEATPSPGSVPSRTGSPADPSDDVADAAARVRTADDNPTPASPVVERGAGGDGRARRGAAESAVARRRDDCITRVAQVLSALGSDEARVVENGRKDWRALETAIAAQLTEVDPAPHSDDPLASVVDAVRHGHNGADTAVVVVDDGAKAHSYVLTDIDGTVVVFDTNIEGAAPRVRTLESWTQSYPHIEEAFVAFFGNDNGTLSALDAPLPDRTGRAHPRHDIEGPPGPSADRDGAGQDRGIPPEPAPEDQHTAATTSRYTVTEYPAQDALRNLPGTDGDPSGTTTSAWSPDTGELIAEHVGSIPPSYAELRRSLRNLHELHPDTTGWETIGSSEGGLPVDVFSLHGSAQDAKPVVIVVDPHPMEQIGRATALALAEYVLAHPVLRADASYHFVVSFDPDSAVLNMRWPTGEGPVDLKKYHMSFHRDLGIKQPEWGFSKVGSAEELPETRAVKVFIDGLGQRPLVLFSLHNAHGGGAYSLVAATGDRHRPIENMLGDLMDELSRRHSVPVEEFPADAEEMTLLGSGAFRYPPVDDMSDPDSWIASVHYAADRGGLGVIIELPEWHTEPSRLTREGAIELLHEQISVFDETYRNLLESVGEGLFGRGAKFMAETLPERIEKLAEPNTPIFGKENIHLFSLRAGGMLLRRMDQLLTSEYRDDPALRAAYATLLRAYDRWCDEAERDLKPMWRPLKSTAGFQLDLVLQVVRNSLYPPESPAGRVPGAGDDTPRPPTDKAPDPSEGSWGNESRSGSYPSWVGRVVELDSPPELWTGGAAGPGDRLERNLRRQREVTEHPHLEKSPPDAPIPDYDENDPYVLPEGYQYVEVSDSQLGRGIMPVMANHRLDELPDTIEEVVIVVHGCLRNADTYLDAYIESQGRYDPARILVIAPQFPAPNDLAALESASSDPRFLRWGMHDWRHGEPAQYPSAPLSSFQPVFSLAYHCWNRCPDIRQLTVIGNSEGGQYTHRLGYLAGVFQPLVDRGITVPLIASNPGTVQSLYRSVPDTSTYPNYANRDYGLDQLHRFRSIGPEHPAARSPFGPENLPPIWLEVLAGLAPDWNGQVRKACEYMIRHVVFCVGAEEILAEDATDEEKLNAANASLPWEEGALAQGVHRPARVRGLLDQLTWKILAGELDPGAALKLVIPPTGHSGAAVTELLMDPVPMDPVAWPAVIEFSLIKELFTRDEARHDSDADPVRIAGLPAPNSEFISPWRLVIHRRRDFDDL